MRRIATAITCIAVLLAGCGGTSMIRPHATERTVTTFVVKHTGYHPTDMRCPSGIPAEVGTRFQCHFSGPEGPYTAYVRILSVEGERVVDHIVTRPSQLQGSVP